MASFFGIGVGIGVGGIVIVVVVWGSGGGGCSGGGWWGDRWLVTGLGALTSWTSESSSDGAEDDEEDPEVVGLPGRPDALYAVRAGFGLGVGHGAVRGCLARAVVVLCPGASGCGLDMFWWADFGYVFCVRS